MLVLFLVGCNSNENLENNNILDNSVEQNQEQIQGTINENEKIKSLLVNGSGWNPVSAYDLINNKESDLFEVYGSGIHYGGTLDFK